MPDRLKVEQLLRELYAARIDGPLERLCGVFTADAHFRIAGTSDGKPIAIAVRGIGEIRPWLAMMVKTFRLANHEIVSMIIDGPRASVHWRADILSRITGAVVPTQLVDLVEVRETRIASYSEFFVAG